MSVGRDRHRIVHAERIVNIKTCSRLAIHAPWLRRGLAQGSAWSYCGGLGWAAGRESRGRPVRGRIRRRDRGCVRLLGAWESWRSPDGASLQLHDAHRVSHRGHDCDHDQRPGSLGPQACGCSGSLVPQAPRRHGSVLGRVRRVVLTYASCLHPGTWPVTLHHGA